MKYCLGEYASFSREEVEIFADCLANILKCNQASNYFSRKKLVKIFEDALICALNNSQLSYIEKKQAYKYAINTGIFTKITRAKVKYHRMY